MSLAVINAGGWDPEEVLTSAQMNALQVELLKAIDGVGGGSYALGAPLIFSGAEFRWSMIARILSGGSLVVASGALLDVFGSLDLENASNLRAKQGSAVTIRKGATLTLEAASNAYINGPSGPDAGARLRVQSGGLVDFLNGSTLDVDDTAVINLDGTLDVQTGGSIEVNAGGGVDVHEGGSITLESGVSTGGRIYVNSGGKILGSSGAEIRVTDSAELTINNSSFAFRLTLNPLMVPQSTPGTFDWVGEIGGTWLMAVAGGINAHLPFALPLRPGDTLTSLFITLQGGAFVGHGGGSPSDMPLFELFSVNASGVRTPIQSKTDTHTGAAYDPVHTETMSGGALPYLVTSNPIYVRVLTEGGSNSFNNRTRLCSIGGMGVARSFRGPSEIYS